jgi:hypothetical protein
MATLQEKAQCMLCLEFKSDVKVQTAFKHGVIIQPQFQSCEDCFASKSNTSNNCLREKVELFSQPKDICKKVQLTSTSTEACTKLRTDIYISVPSGLATFVMNR